MSRSKLKILKKLFKKKRMRCYDNYDKYLSRLAVALVK